MVEKVEEVKVVVVVVVKEEEVVDFLEDRVGGNGDLGSGDGRRGLSSEVVGSHRASPASSRRRWRPSGLGERDSRERIETVSERVRREKRL